MEFNTCNRNLACGISVTLSPVVHFSSQLRIFEQVRETVITEVQCSRDLPIDENDPVSYTHLTLPTTPYV